MANYNYTAKASFRPFTFDEMLRPLAMYTQEYNTIQDSLGELNTKASIFDKLANEQTDSRAYSLYKSYSNDLKSMAESLAKKGLTPESRQGLINMKRRYSSDIVPLEQAYTARAEEAKSQYAGRANGIVYEGDAASSSLDRYLDNPTIRYNQANSQEGFKRIATTASALAKGLRNYGNGKSLDKYTKTWLQEHGYRDYEVAEAISDIRKIIQGDTNIDTNNVLKAILNDELYTSGLNTWTNKEAVRDYFNRVAPALYQAVGQTQVSPYENYEAKLQYKSNYGNNPIINGLALNPTSVLSPKERSDLEVKAKESINKFKQYFVTDEDGNIKLNKKGLEELKRNASPRVSIAGSGSGTAALMNAETMMNNTNKFVPTEFRKFMENLGMNTDKIDIKEINKLWNNYLNDPISIEAGYDTSKYTVYNYDLSPTQQGIWKDKLFRVLPEEGLQEVSWDYKSKNFKPTGDYLDLETLNDKDTTILSVDLSTYGENNKGNIIWVRDKDGNTKRYKLPSGISERNEDAAQQYLEYAKYLEQIPNGGMLPNGKLANSEQVADEYKKALTSMQFHLSQLGLTNEIEKQVTNPYSW